MIPVADAVIAELDALDSEAAVVAKYDRDKGGLIAAIADRIREKVDAHLSPWVPLSQVQERTGYCADTLRDKAGALEAQGLASKQGGRWYIERGAVTRMQVSRRSKPVGVGEWSDVDSLARRLATEE